MEDFTTFISVMATTTILGLVILISPFLRSYIFDNDRKLKELFAKDDFTVDDVIGNESSVGEDSSMENGQDKGGESRNNVVMTMETLHGNSSPSLQQHCCRL